MPPASNSVSASSKSKNNRFSTSPDSDPTTSVPEPQPVSGKKKKKNAASKQAQVNNTHRDDPSNSEIARADTPPPARPQTILSQIGHGFPIPSRRDSPLLDVEDEEVTTTEKVSDQYTPPNENWLEDNLYGKETPTEQPAKLIRDAQVPIEPGFSTRARYDSKSPPISPPIRHARPVSYGGGTPYVPPIPRASPSAYSYAPSAYGSPPAPHLPQPHFYHAQDVNLGLPRTTVPAYREEASFVKYTQLPSSYGSSQHGILLGFESRINVMRVDGGPVDEIGVLEGFSGAVIDAAFIEWNVGPDPLAAFRPLIALVVHGPRELQQDHPTGTRQEDVMTHIRQQPGKLSNEYTTRVEVYSMSTQERLAVLLETPGQMPQSVFRGAPPTPPNPIGQLKLQVSGSFIIISSGISGEVFAFTVLSDSQPIFECIGKFWTAIQPQIQRRDSSHHQSSDPDISPADLGRAARNTERAISSVNGRWLVISPASAPSRPSLGASVGFNVVCARRATIETTSAPTRPSISCEVDSPDADTLFGKVARGVAQELVKGAKWLGDQGYQTWQSYWRKEQSPSASGASPVYSSPIHPAGLSPNSFPPTHGDLQQNTKEPELVSIYDLQALHELAMKKGVDEMRPLATFQPPRGCSFVSFAPHGLNLLTAGRKGDVQYVWNLMQIKHCRTYVSSVDDERIRVQPSVRQIAKYERLSGSTIVDVIWDSPVGARFAVLTKNKTIHLFDLPPSAFRWPPPRALKKSRPASRSVDNTQHDTSISSGFFASAMNIANQAQPMIANWRGRAPSMGGGLAGIGQTGIGLASATGARGSKVVAAGLSRSLGAASETVHQIRHAGESRLHLKTNKDPIPGKIVWIQQGRRCTLAIIEADMIKQYQVRRSKNQEKRDTVTVFAARKASFVKLPVPLQLMENDTAAQPVNEGIDQQLLSGFWKAKPSTSQTQRALEHPLSFAEIETNAPYQPFHSDRRVILSIYSDTTQHRGSQMSDTAVAGNSRSQAKSSKMVKAHDNWVFGDDIPTVTLGISKIQVPDYEDEYTGSVIYRETVQVTSPTAGDENMDQIVSTTRRRKLRKGQDSSRGGGSDNDKEDGFFEDDCDVLDFATDRV